MNTIYTLVLRYQPQRVIIWSGEETLYDGTRGNLFDYIDGAVVWIRYEYFKETGELIINV